MLAVPPQAAEPGATVLAGALSAPDATMLAVPQAAPDATMLATRPAAPAATMLATPQNAPDATMLAGSLTAFEGGATFLAPAQASPGEAATTFAPRTPAGNPRPAPGAGSPGESGPLEIGEQFGRYTIVKMLGIGGMGAVYQAWDQELDVVVALKVIRPEVMRDPVAAAEIERRFKRELLLARQVTHKNVVRIHDLGEIRGIKYITMTFVDGKDLSTIVTRDGPLPIPQILHTMRGVVSGLVAAHAAGVVHRDLKPANIMIDADGDPLIMDFGIARSTGAPADISSSAVVSKAIGPKATGRYTDATMLGSIVGTVEYMAPEQARGEAVDHRADIYTTGLILYDLLAGRRRAQGTGSALDQLRARIETPLPPLKSVAPNVPDALAHIVMRAVEADPAKRFQTTPELAAALERLDDQGVPKPIKRAVSLPMMAGIVTVLVALAGGGWWWTRQDPPPAVHEPVSVVIADFENRTGDPTFDRTLEPMLRRALEGAGFITAYDRSGIRRTVGATLPEKLDESAARELAVKQGLGIVLSGAIEKQGSGFSVSMKATKTVTGEVIADERARAAASDRVIPAATTLVSSIRKALGDESSDTNPIFAKASLSASSLEVVKHYAAAMEHTSNNRFAEARESLLKAVELDPSFGVGYLVLASVSRNMGQVGDATKYINEAMSHLDGMTERERYTTRGMLYRLTGDYQQCVKEHSELITRYAADVIGHNQLALCASQLRDLTRARDEMREVVKILPMRAVFRDNLALYSNYASDFETGEKESRTVLETAPNDPFALLALAMSQIGQGKLTDAEATYARLAPIPGLGATFSSMGLGDLAIIEGRYADAMKLLEQGAAADLVAKNPDRAATKIAAVAYAQLLRGQKAAAVAAADRSLATSAVVKIRFLAARIYVEAGQPARARPLITALSAELQPEPQAYGKILEAMMAVTGKDARPAIKLLTDANALLDTWIGHFELGRAYVALGQFPQADSEFDRCLKRRGEALALFLDEEPTFGYLPSVYYYQGRAKEGMKLAGAAESFRAYLSLRAGAGEDALLADIRRRISAPPPGK